MDNLQQMQNSGSRLIVGGLLAALLIASLLPWLYVNPYESFSFGPIDAMRATLNRGIPDPTDFEKGDFGSLIWSVNTFTAFGSAAFLYLVSIILIGISFASSNSRKAFAQLGGCLAIASTVAWLYGVESLKAQLLVDAKFGGPLAQLGDGFVNSVIVTGAGAYLVCAVGIVALAFSFMKRWPESKRIDVLLEELSHESVPARDDPPKARPPYQKPDSHAQAQIPSINRIVYKSSGTAALLAFVGAIIGLPGMGHIYVGRVGRGLLILFSGFALYYLGWIIILGGLLIGSLARSFPIFQAGIGLGIALLVMYFGLLIWQIFNARSLAKKLNESVQLTGKEPW